MVSAPSPHRRPEYPGLLAKLLARVRPEFRVEVYLADPDDPVLGVDGVGCPVATGPGPRAGCARVMVGAGAPGAARRWPCSSPTRGPR